MRLVNQDIFEGHRMSVKSVEDVSAMAMEICVIPLVEKNAIVEITQKVVSFFVENDKKMLIHKI